MRLLMGLSPIESLGSFVQRTLGPPSFRGTYIPMGSLGVSDLVLQDHNKWVEQRAFTVGQRVYIWSDGVSDGDAGPFVVLEVNKEQRWAILCTPKEWDDRTWLSSGGMEWSFDDLCDEVFPELEMTEYP